MIRAEAASVLAASAAMGESIPPSIAILAFGSVTSISTGALFLAGLLPAATIAALPDGAGLSARALARAAARAARAADPCASLPDGAPSSRC